MQAFSWGPMQGNLQPLQSQHPGLQGETGSALTFGHKLIIYSLLGISPVKDMAHPSLYPQAVSVQEPAKLCFSQNTETKQNHKSTKSLRKSLKPLSQHRLGSVAPTITQVTTSRRWQTSLLLPEKASISTRHRLRATAHSLAGPTKSLLKIIMVLAASGCDFCCCADVSI